jgi:hypothetical protein
MHTSLSAKITKRPSVAALSDFFAIVHDGEDQEAAVLTALFNWWFHTAFSFRAVRSSSAAAGAL